MWTAGGAGGSGFGGPTDAGALAQQYWNALSEAMRSASGAARPQNPWQSAMDSWSQLAGGARRNDASDTIERFSAQARQWFGMMQQVAGQFAGRSANAEDIASAWKQAMGGGGNPFASLFTEMTGRGQSGFDQWYQQIAPMFNGMLGSSMLGGMHQDRMHGLRMPAFGLNREQQERWQSLTEAQLELQQKNEAYSALMLEAGREAFDRFERKLAERSEPGRQLQSARALFDLWIDAAEEAYAEIALSNGFRKVYGELVNAQMRVRAGIQREIELIGGLFGMPGRTEVDAAHRKIAELERQLRRLRDAVPAQPVQANPTSRKPASAEKVEVPKAAKPAQKSAAKTKLIAKNLVAKKAVMKKVAAKKVAAKGAIVKKLPVAKSRPSRATAKTSVKRAPRQTIAAIAMPEPLKPMPMKQTAAAKTANRKR
jgi:polyhydroxyalkanoate synthase subunit PhaE